MKTFSFRNLFVLVALAIALMGFTPKSHAAVDDVTVSAVAGWIVKHTKEQIKWPQAVKIASVVFDEVSSHRIDPYLVVAMISAESMFNTKAGSSAGARGLMQVMPRWHKDKIKGRNIYDVRTNIEVGVQILQDCLVKASDRMTRGLKCYSGGASKKYETRIIAAHSSLKEAVMVARFDKEVPIVAVASYDKPRYWHSQMERYAVSERKRKEDLMMARNDYELLIVAMNQNSTPGKIRMY